LSDDDTEVKTRTWTEFRVDLSYVFSVDDERIRCSSLFPGEDVFYTDHAQAESVVKRYAKGTRIPAYYNPDAPSEAYLDVSPSLNPVFMLLMGSVFLTACFLAAGGIVWLAFLFGPSKRDKTPPPNAPAAAGQPPHP
jgi:hypothetical protein